VHPIKVSSWTDELATIIITDTLLMNFVLARVAVTNLPNFKNGKIISNFMKNFKVLAKKSTAQLMISFIPMPYTFSLYQKAS